MLRVVRQHFLELFFRLGVTFFAFKCRATQEPDVLLVLIFGAELLGFVERLLGIAEAPQARPHLRQRDINLPVLAIALEQRAHLLQPFVGLAHIGLLRSQHHLQVAAVGKLLHSLFRDIGGLLPFLGFAPGVDDLLITAFDVVFAA